MFNFQLGVVVPIPKLPVKKELAVVVAVHVGTPFCRAKVKPSVPDDVVDSLPVPLPKRMELA